MADESVDPYTAFAAEIDRGGWISMTNRRPRPYTRVQFFRFEWDMPWEGMLVELPPETNSYGLYWRPVATMKDMTPAASENLPIAAHGLPWPSTGHSEQEG